MSIATLTRRMLELGASPEVIAVAIEAVTLSSRDASRPVTVPKRSPAAIRAARYRKKLKQHKGKAEANDAAPAGAEQRDDSRDASRDGVTAPLLSLKEEGTFDEGLKKEKKNSSGSARARGTRMQPGAVLTDEYRAAAIKLGAPPHTVDEMWVEHVDYWVAVPGERGVKTDWLATWRNDVRRKLKLGTYNGARPHHGNRSTGAADFFAGLAEVAADIDRDGAVARAPADDIPLGRHNIDAEPAGRG